MKNYWFCNIGVNFINILRTYVVYSSAFFYVKKAAEKTFVRKIRAYNVDDIDTKSLLPRLQILIKTLDFKVCGRAKMLPFHFLMVVSRLNVHWLLASRGALRLPGLILRFGFGRKKSGHRFDDEVQTYI